MITQARYRTDYEGEFVVVESVWRNGRKEQKREWVPNQIENQHISGRAAIIISDSDLVDFNHTIGSKKLQTYGLGKISQQMRLDFTVETDSAVLKEIKSRNYQVNNIVYTTTRQCLLNPGEFYLIPFNPTMCLESLALYLAAFDGHKEIFIIGANNDTVGSNSAWTYHMSKVFELYRSTQFVSVGRPHNTIEHWFNCPNFKTITHREFISYCDC
jgi:hypothetical protein